MYEKFITNVQEDIGNVDATYGLTGYAAPWVVEGDVVLIGGAKQMSMPFTGDALEALGLLAKIK